MNWKHFTIACVSSLLVIIPHSSNPCGDTENPHDYFTSFFSRSVSGKAYYPFYYTSLLQFYDQDWYWNSQDDSLAYVHPGIVAEWADYANATKADVTRLIYKSKQAQLQLLSNNYKAAKPLEGTLAKNTLAVNLVKQKNTEAINYLLFAKRMEKVSDPGKWSDATRDSLLLNKYINEADAAINKTADIFIKQRYAYQKCKLAFYNNRYDDCSRWYDQHFKEDDNSAVNELALSYKAGSFFRSGRNKEAAYYFSKVFPKGEKFNKSNFLGFLWATNYCDSSLIPDYISLCRNDKEKAMMLGMFAMHGTAYRLDLLKNVYALDPSSPLLPLLATREVNKLEEQYFTALLYKENGGRPSYFSWSYDETNNEEAQQLITGKRQVAQTASFLEKLFADKKVFNHSFYGNAAAYLHFMNKDHTAANNLLSKIKSTDKRIADQSQLVSLLIIADNAVKIDAAKEAELLPALKWLVQKASEDEEYMIFCRNFFTEILAQKYEQQGDIHKAALSYAMVQVPFNKKMEMYYSYVRSLDYVQDEMNTSQVLRLYDAMINPSTEIEKFLLSKGTLTKDDVIDVIGTSYLRDRNYTKAIEWLSKAAKAQKLVTERYVYGIDKILYLNADPFHDYLNDWQRFDKTSTTPYTKLTLAKKLLELKKQVDANTTANKAKLYYRYANALYNMSYYGNSWDAVAYDRSGSDWNEGNYKLQWQEEYYGVHEAKEYYQKAYEAATDREFKAASLFMVAKCLQRQVVRPPYDYADYEAYRQKEIAFEKQFRNNPLFARFKAEFGTTKFYSYTYNRCSYLRDFVRKQGN